MSSVHCVVVWEFEAAGGHWVPHTPGVTRTLERAHAKKLTRVVLADADPALNGHYVNLRTLTQCRDMPDGSTAAECLVRRSCYSVQSVGGRGARWEWARLSSPPLPAELHYEPMPMEMQCMVEAAWCSGAEHAHCGGWAVAVAGGAGAGLARRGAAVRLVRRAPQPPYPLTRSEPAAHHTVPVRRARIPHQLTGAGASEHSAPHPAPAPAPPAPAVARSASPKDRKHNLARQILHNLNIFSNSKQLAAPSDSEHEHEHGHAQETCSSSGRSPARADADSTRRHSVDTVSTYLSHESKDSMQRGSVGELLDCSGGSDDVFECTRDADAHADAHADAEEDADNDADALGEQVIDMVSLGVGVGACGWARHVPQPQWGAVCPVCMRALCGGGGAGGAGLGGGGPVVSLHGCHHMLHLHCLADQLRAAVAVDRLDHATESVFIECLVCGRRYGAAPLRATPRAELATPRPGGAGAAQPPGSMAWRLQHAALPQCSAPNAILVTYNFQSGVQGCGHPAPGSRYYAVGFPRHSVLPDDALGRQVLAALRSLWARGLLFTVRASRTTGREHVVTWRAARPPPPASPHHYLPPARPRPLLRAALAALTDLTDQ